MLLEKYGKDLIDRLTPHNEKFKKMSIRESKKWYR